MKFSKRQKIINEKVVDKFYEIDEAVDLLKSCSSVKFVEGVDVSLNLGIDSRKSDQVVRGATVLPFGTGRSVKVAVFAQDDKAEEARKAGADVVGLDDLAQQVQDGKLDFDVVIATPDAMRIVGKLGQILGPRGLMPNPKVGTVTADVGKAVKNAKSGQVRYRADKNGIIHCSIGKINFESEAIKGNLRILVSDVKKLKPSSAKGVYLKKISLSTTMGPGLAIDLSSI